MSGDVVWIPAVPLPFILLGRDQCICGRHFWFLNRRARYELHYRLEHEGESEAGESTVMVGLPPSEAKRIYDAVADLRKR